jgi:hypothetical protein
MQGLECYWLSDVDVTSSIDAPHSSNAKELLNLVAVSNDLSDEGLRIVRGRTVR